MSVVKLKFSVQKKKKGKIKSTVCDPGTLVFFKTLTVKILLLFIVDVGKHMITLQNLTIFGNL